MKAIEPRYFASNGLAQGFVAWLVLDRRLYPGMPPTPVASFASFLPNAWQSAELLARQLNGTS